MVSDELVGRSLCTRKYCGVFASSMLIVKASSPCLVGLGLTKERSLRILFRSVTTPIERMSNEGFAMCNARNKGSSGESGWRVAFWAM